LIGKNTGEVQFIGQSKQFRNTCPKQVEQHVYLVARSMVLLLASCNLTDKVFIVIIVRWITQRPKNCLSRDKYLHFSKQSNAELVLYFYLVLLAAVPKITS